MSNFARRCKVSSTLLPIALFAKKIKKFKAIQEFKEFVLRFILQKDKIRLNSVLDRAPIKIGYIKQKLFSISE